MTPSRPYLLRALYQWILDNNMTPHVVINANYKDVIVPREHVENGQIILSIAPAAVHNLEIKNDSIAFAARFSGASRDIYLPIMSVTAIYSEENRKGMVFADEFFDTEGEKTDSLKAVPSDSKHETLSKTKKSGTRPKLTVVASNPDIDKKDK